MNTINIKKSELRFLLNIAKADSVRNYGTVIFFDSDRLVATDGFRLSYIKTNVPESIVGTSINAKVFKTALTFIEKSGFTLEKIDEDWLELGYKFLLRFKASAVKFPNYKAVLPKKEAKQVFTFDSAELKTLIQSKLADSDRSKVVDFSEVLSGLKLNGKFLLDSIVVSKTPETMVEVFADATDPIRIKSGNMVTILVPIH